MNPEIKEQWLTALRSGEYKQGKGYLRQSNNTFCCLGVLTDLAVKAGVIKEGVDDGHRYEYEFCNGDTPYKVDEWSGLNEHDDWASNVKLMTMNDEDGLDFDQIAFWIEGNL